jgi:nucleotide-binding universal stress UspA family protein
VRVLIATDGSPHAQRAVSLAAAQAWPAGTLLRVIVVDDGRIGPHGSGGTPVDVDVAANVIDLADLAARAVEAFDRPGWTVDSEVLRGRAASVIVDEGARFNADLVVVGSRGRGPLGSLALGSVSAEVVDHAGRPVLVARTDGRIDRVVLADDGSPAAIRARRLLADWDAFAASQITVACVVHVPAPLHSAIAPTMVRAALADYQLSLEQAREACDRACKAAADTLAAAGRQVTARTREGDAATGVIQTARDDAADLIVVGSRGHTGLTRLLLGSVARNVLYEAPCSVLVVR